MSLKVKKIMLSDGTHFYDNRTNEEMRADAAVLIKKWQEENPEEVAATRQRSGNEWKYRNSGIYYEELSKGN